MIRFPNFEPDRTKFALDASVAITNCLPVADGWGPLPDIAAFTSSLGAACVGMCVVRTTAGAYRLIAGTATALKELNLTDYTWTDLTRLAGGAYAVPSGDRWSFAVYGANLIACNLTDDVQYIGIDAGTNFAALSGSPPKAKYVWVAGEFLVLGSLAGFPNRIHVSGQGDATHWTIGSRGSDRQDFPDGEEVMGGIGAEKGAIIFQRTMIRQMTIAQVGDYSFQTAIVNPKRGVIAPLSIAQIGPGQFFYLSADGFFTGAEGKPIGAERVDRWFINQINQSKIGEIRSVADPFNKIVWTQAETPNATKFLLGYNWQLDRWCYADNNVSEMAVMATPGVSWDGLDVIYATIDDVDASFDSSLFTGGLPRFAAFTTANELGFFSGASRAATLDTPDVELNPGFRTLVDAVRVYTDATDFTLKAITSDKHGGTRTIGNAKSPSSRSGLCHMRSDARIHALRMEIAAGATWNHVMGLEPEDAQRTGRV